MAQNRPPLERYKHRREEQSRHFQESSAVSTMSNSAVYSTITSDARCTEDPTLCELRAKNLATARQRQQSSEEYKVRGRDLDEVRDELRKHCELRLELCRSKKQELQLEREIIENDRDLTPKEVENQNRLLNELEREIYILQKQSNRLIGIALLSKCGNLAQSWDNLANAYGQALATITSSLPLSAKDKDIWPGGREEVDQANFRQSLNDCYNPDRKPKDPKWCPVSREYVRYYDVKAAHIVPFALGDVNVSFFFGDPLEKGYQRIWNIGNGLILHKKIELLFDQAAIQIVPGHSKDQAVGCLKVVVLDPEALTGHEDLGDLEGRELEFPDGISTRPQPEYLYISCVLAALRRKRFGCRGWRDDYEKLFGEPAWPHVQLDLNKSSLFALAAAAGDLGRFEKALKRFSFRKTPSSANSELDEATLAPALFGKPPANNHVVDDGGSTDAEKAELKLQESQAENQSIEFRGQREELVAEYEEKIKAFQDEQVRKEAEIEEKTKEFQAEQVRKDAEIEALKARVQRMEEEKKNLETRLAESGAVIAQLRRTVERKVSSFGETVLAKLRR
ncbi:hypothetical protein AYL99_11794 [Fonsecaea erecta]|uniref:HNH nuclease domain-containing protein n=1 Tax=Fonsecaea erecta TaxID=1367422 RepID=A0A178Z2V7_9EURO|nr:hypothetical protein AYL99_11794 [Fonsecaea erecta]OAP54034.1 hypothetical protein AYL99_11794 [Fonsecaea erecta]